MRAVLPFAWNRLLADQQRTLLAYQSHFLICPLLTCTFSQIPAPTQLPDYLLFTSVNGIRAALQQSWFQGQWHHRHVVVIGSKTALFAKNAGLNVHMGLDPPAISRLPDLPGGTGVWFSGEEIAADLTTQLPPGALHRLPIYSLVLDKAQAQRLHHELTVGDVGAAFITSDRVLREFYPIVQSSKAHIKRCAVLSRRLDVRTREIFPTATTEIVPTLETGVQWLLKGLKRSEKGEK